MVFSQRRYLTYFILSLLIFSMPFLKINGNQILLLSFDKMQFHFLGFVYNMNELYLMPFLLIFLFIFIFAITTILGRFWCAWACPQTIFRVIYRDLIESKIFKLRRIKNKQKELDYSKNSVKIKKYLSLFIWSILSLLISMNFMWYFVPPSDFFSYLQNPLEHFFMVMFILSTSLFLIFDIVFMKEDFCTFVCPYSRIQSTFYDNNTKQVIYNTNRGGHVYQNGKKSIFNKKQWNFNEECITCEACVKVCPTHIDIRKGLQVECINCLECSDACSLVMKKLGKKSLIYWASTNEIFNKKKSSLFSIKNFVYFLSLFSCLVLVTYFSIKKEDFLVNINRTTNLYKIDKDVITNNYILTIHNTTKDKYTFDIEILDSKFKIKRYKKLSLKPKQRRKTILVLQSSKNLASRPKINNPYRVKINIFAKENKKIKIEKYLSFNYPKEDLFK